MGEIAQPAAQTDTLAFSSTESGLALLCILIGSIPGAIVAGYTITRLNPVRSSILGTFFLAGITLAAAGILKGPGQQMESYLLCLLWGSVSLLREIGGFLPSYEIQITKGNNSSDNWMDLDNGSYAGVNLVRVFPYMHCCFFLGFAETLIILSGFRQGRMLN